MQEEEEEPLLKKEKTAFTVKLTKFDETKKVQLIKELKSIMEGMNLVQVIEACFGIVNNLKLFTGFIAVRKFFES